MLCFELTPVPTTTQDPGGFIGGAPSLPTGTNWPRCGMCGDDLHFLDIALPEGSSPFKPGSRLQVFACRQHDDIAGTIYSNYETFGSAAMSKQLPDGYWTLTDGPLMALKLFGNPSWAQDPEDHVCCCG